MKSVVQHLGLTLAALGAAITFSANANAANCYAFNAENPTAETKAAPVTEVWCYENIPGTGMFIYNADGEKAKAELAMLVNPRGLLIHGSLNAGVVTIEKVKASEFNPFSVPLAEPTTLAKVQPKFAGEAFTQSVDEVLILLSTTKAFAVPQVFALQVGTLQASATQRPWRGTSWAFRKQQMYSSSDSPMAKYDRFVQNLTGRNPGAQDWEASHHNSPENWWGGHCNGWAAAAILRAEPKAPRGDRDVVFNISDQKALYTELDFCSNVAFFGNRNNGPTKDLKDIDPVLFHKVLTYYVGSLRKPVAMDYRPDAVVDTHVISGYTLTITALDPQNFKVNAALTMHSYDKDPSETPGIATTYTRKYAYTLTRGANGEITGGSWQSENPDFMWVPLSPLYCNQANPAVRPDLVDKIMSLPTTRYEEPRGDRWDRDNDRWGRDRDRDRDDDDDNWWDGWGRRR